MYMATIGVYVSRLTGNSKWQIFLVFSLIMYEMLLHFHAHIKPIS